MSDTRQRLAKLSPERRALLMRRLQERGGQRPEAVDLWPQLAPDSVHRHDPFPLTPLQQAYWVGRDSAFEMGQVATHSYMELEGEGLDPRSTGPPPEEPAVEERPAGEPAVELSGESPAARDGLLRSGFLRIGAHPADAAVYLDGEFLARADELARLHGALSVAIGTHVIEVVRPGYESQTATVEVSGKEPVRVVVRLRVRVD